MQPTRQLRRPRKKAAAKPEGKRHLGLWSGVFLLSLAALALLIAADVSHYFGNRALKVLYNDEGEGVANPEYETAEQVWANGDHLEAIRLMREYLNKHPREQFVALRIAEIYEKDLNNPLAAEACLSAAMPYPNSRVEFNGCKTFLGSIIYWTSNFRIWR